MKPNIKKYGIFLALFAFAAAAFALLVLLFVKCKECNEPDVKILIGFPVEGTGTPPAVDYTNSEPISDKQTVNRILFAMLSGKSLAGSAVPNTPPDTVMMVMVIGPEKENYAYPFSVWVDQNSVIYAMGTGDEATEYRVIDHLSDEVCRIFDGSKTAKG